MKRTIQILSVIGLVFTLAVSAQAATLTVNFDDITASNGAYLIGEEYADMGLHFNNYPTIEETYNDGRVYDNALAPFGSALSGDQFLVMETNGNYLAIHFDTPVESASYYVLTQAVYPQGRLFAVFWLGLPGELGHIDQGYDVQFLSGSEAGWVPFDTSAAEGPFDWLIFFDKEISVACAIDDLSWTTGKTRKKPR